MGNPQWCRDDKFSSFAARKAHEDELESLIGQWTIRYDCDELMTLLQKAGVPPARFRTGLIWSTETLSCRNGKAL